MTENIEPTAAAPADTVSFSKRTLTIVGVLALAAVMLAGTFATGFVVGSHASRFGGRDGFAPGGPPAMMGDFRGPDDGWGQGAPGQGRGQGGRGMMRDRGQQWPGGGQQQAPDAQGQQQAPAVPGQ